MKKKFDLAIKGSLIVVSCIFLISIIIVGLSTWSMSDDYALRAAIREEGIWRHMINGYNEWDGRFISIGLIQSILLSFLPISIINAIWGLCLILSAYLFYKILKFNINSPFKKTRDFLLIPITALFTIVLWYGMRSHVAETVFWATGGVYILMVLLSLIWVFFMLKIKKAEYNISRKWYLAFLLFSVYIGALSHNLTFSIITFIFFEALFPFSNKDDLVKRKRYKFFISVLISVIIGAAIIFLAPGNSNRAAYGNNSFVYELNTIWNNFVTVFNYYISLSDPLFITIIGTILLSLALFLMDFKIGLPKVLVIKLSLPKEIRIFLNQDVITKIAKFVQYPLCAIASIVPFTLIPDFAAARTSIFFMEFVILWAVVVVIPGICNFIIKKKSNDSSFGTSFVLILTILYIAFFQYIIYTHVVDLNETKEIVLRREEYIQTFSNQDIDLIVGKIERPASFSYSYMDISDDKDNFVNKEVSTYYGIKSIQTDNSFFK